MRKILADTEIHSSVRQDVMHFHTDIVDEVQQAVQQHRIVVVGMRWNDAVWQARKNLKKAGLEFKYLEYGSYTSGWRRRLALKMWAGFPTFPMVFIDQQLVGGNSDLVKLLKDGSIS